MARKAKEKADRPFVADKDAAAKLELAAQAAGLTQQQLVDLVADSGLLTTPTSERVLKDYTLEDMGRKLWFSMQEVPRSKRAEWFAGLLDTQKTAVIVVLRDRGFATEAISREFQVDAAQVMRTWNAYASEIGAQIVGLRLDTIAGQMQLVSERAQHMASEAGDHKAMWNIEKEKVALMQSIGIVDKAIHRVEVSHKFDDSAKAEIEALADLRMKQRIRLAEVKMIEQETDQGDPVPVIEKEEDDE